MVVRRLTYRVDYIEIPTIFSVIRVLDGDEDSARRKYPFTEYTDNRIFDSPYVPARGLLISAHGHLVSVKA